MTVEAGQTLPVCIPDTDPEIDVFLATPFWEWGTQLSADGRFVAYSSAESGSGEVYVRALDGAGAQVKISTSSVREAQWAAPEELPYRPGDKIPSVSLSVEDGVLKPALPQQLLDLPMPPWSLRSRVARQGQRVLLTKSLESTSTRHDPVVVINRIDELEAKVPAAK